MQAIDTRIEQLATAASCLGLGSGLWAIVALHLLPAHLNTSNFAPPTPSDTSDPPPLELRLIDLQQAPQNIASDPSTGPARLVCGPEHTPTTIVRALEPNKRPSPAVAPKATLDDAYRARLAEPNLILAGQGGQLRATPPAPVVQRLHTLHFGLSKTKIGYHQTKQLADLVRTLRPGMRLIVVGYTDTSGTFAVNRRLERRRAQAVADRLRGLAGNIGGLDIQSIGSTADFNHQNIARARVSHRGRGARARRADIYLIPHTQNRIMAWKRFN